MGSAPKDERAKTRLLFLLSLSTGEEAFEKPGQLLKLPMVE
jgi:hypothetical protein